MMIVMIGVAAPLAAAAMEPENPCNKEETL